MDHESPEIIKKHVRVYLGIFGVLIVMTFLTVFVNSFKLPLTAALIVAMSIATFKSSLVAGFFMHLIGEKKIIHWTLLSIIIFFLALMIIPAMTIHDSAGKSIAPPTKEIVRIH